MMRRKVEIAAISVLFLVLMASLSVAQYTEHYGGQATAQMRGGESGEETQARKEREKPQEKVKENVKLVGQVIDSVCYIRHESMGKKHKECAIKCAKQGITLGILEEGTGKIYLSFPEGHGNPNKKLLDYVEERVEVTGTVYTAGGVTGIEVKTIKRAPK